MRLRLASAAVDELGAEHAAAQAALKKALEQRRAHLAAVILRRDELKEIQRELIASLQLSLIASAEVAELDNADLRLSLANSQQVELAFKQAQVRFLLLFLCFKDIPALDRPKPFRRLIDLRVGGLCASR